MGLFVRHKLGSIGNTGKASEKITLEYTIFE